jgi:hypothetical protein
VKHVPGSGKSALLRTLVLDVFADEPRFISGLDRWHELLPVWLPFAFWTQAARARRLRLDEGADAGMVASGHRPNCLAPDVHRLQQIERDIRQPKLLAWPQIELGVVQLDEAITYLGRDLELWLDDAAQTVVERVG